MPLYNDISPQTLMNLGIILAIVFVFVVFVVFRDVYILRKSHDALDNRIQKLRLGSMLHRLYIPLKKYDHKTSDLDKERHIWTCEHCPNLDECDCMFRGENIDPKTFCPNYEELEILKHPKI
jgi:hypothetical protein